VLIVPVEFVSIAMPSVCRGERRAEFSVGAVYEGVNTLKERTNSQSAFADRQFVTSLCISNIADRKRIFQIGEWRLLIANRRKANAVAIHLHLQEERALIERPYKSKATWSYSAANGSRDNSGHARQSR
jgi:hypothetical protein